MTALATTLVLGGAHSGKSAFAEQLVGESGLARIYLATATAGDDEMRSRIAHHRERRGDGWVTIEEPMALVDALTREATHGRAVLVDCLTLWLSRTMDALDIWSDLSRAGLVEERIAELADAWSRTPRLVVAVSNDIGSGVVPADPGTRLFRDLMGRLNTTISLASDQVLWTIAGRTLPLT